MCFSYITGFYWLCYIWSFSFIMILVMKFSLCFCSTMPVSIQQKDGRSSFEFPPAWEDDKRMAFLFSAFKANREVDPSDWDDKMNFWTPLVVQSCRQRGLVCTSLQELNEIFRRKGNVPMGLSTVIQCMIRYCSCLQYNWMWYWWTNPLNFNFNV